MLSVSLCGMRAQLPPPTADLALEHGDARTPERRHPRVQEKGGCWKSRFIGLCLRFYVYSKRSRGV